MIDYLQIAEIAQLVERNLAKVGVASSSLVFRSRNQQLTEMKLLIFLFIRGGKETKAPFHGPGSHCLSIKLPIGNMFSLLRQTMQINGFRTNTPARTWSISPRYAPCVPGTNAGNRKH